MRQAEIDNYKGTKENQELQNAWMNMVMQPETMDVAQKHGIMNSITGTMVTVSHNAWVRDSELIQHLGEADAVKENALFEEMHELVKTGRETGKIPGYENVNNIPEIISKTDEKGVSHLFAKDGEELLERTKRDLAYSCDLYDKDGKLLSIMFWAF